MRYALIDQNGIVVNTVELTDQSGLPSIPSAPGVDATADDVAQYALFLAAANRDRYQVSAGYQIVPHDTAEIGDSYANGVIVPAPIIPPTTEEMAANIDAQLEKLDAKLPRAVEDMWVLANVDTTKIPSTQLDLQAQKNVLRAARKALSA